MHHGSFGAIACRGLWLGLLVSFLMFGASVGTSQDTKPTTLTGSVYEMTGDGPKKPISGAKLSLSPGGAKALSNADGVYRFPEVQSGKYILTVKVDGYRETMREINAKKAVTEDICLWPLELTKGLSISVGSQIAVRVQQKKSTYPKEWFQLRWDALPPPNKFWVIKGIEEKDAKAGSTFPPFKDYLEARLENIEKATEMFRVAIEKKNRVPPPAVLSDLNVKNEVVVDIMVFHLRASPASKERKAQFLGEFTEVWKVKDLDKRIKIYLPKE